MGAKHGRPLFQHASNFENRLHVRRIARGDGIIAPGPCHDESLAFQLLQGLTGRHPADAELEGDLLLPQPLTRLVLAPEDPIPQLPIDVRWNALERFLRILIEENSGEVADLGLMYTSLKNRHQPDCPAPGSAALSHLLAPTAHVRLERLWIRAPKRAASER